MRTEINELEVYKTIVLNDFKKKAPLNNIEHLVRSMQMKEYIHLLSALDYNGEYALCTNGRIYFLDGIGYMSEPFTLIEDIPFIDPNITVIYGHTPEVVESLKKTLIYLLDEYNSSFVRPDNKSLRINYINK